jgi:hypothetical protein
LVAPSKLLRQSNQFRVFGIRFRLPLSAPRSERLPLSLYFQFVTFSINRGFHSSVFACWIYSLLPYSRHSKHFIFSFCFRNTKQHCCVVTNWYCRINSGYSWPIATSAVAIQLQFSGMFYPGNDVVDSLPYTNFGSSTKRLKENDLVRDSANN